MLSERLSGPSRRAWRIHHFEVTTSTNETILAAAEKGEPEWTVHVASHQTRGRGRGSHTWWSPAGKGLWMSILLRPTAQPRRLGGLALLAGKAVRDALLSLGSEGIDLYWPNDLYFRGRKLGGILGEVRYPAAQPGQTPGAIVALGIGINLDLASNDAPPELQGAIAHLSETGAGRREPALVAPAILDHLDPLYRSFLQGASIPRLVEEAMSGSGKGVKVRVPPALPWPGTMLGIGEEGELLVRRHNGEVEGLRSAEVEYEP